MRANHSIICESCGEEQPAKYFRLANGSYSDTCSDCRAEDNSAFQDLRATAADNPGYKSCDCEDWPCCGH